MQLNIFCLKIIFLLVLYLWNSYSCMVVNVFPGWFCCTEQEVRVLKTVCYSKRLLAGKVAEDVTGEQERAATCQTGLLWLSGQLAESLRDRNEQDGLAGLCLCEGRGRQLTCRHLSPLFVADQASPALWLLTPSFSLQRLHLTLTSTWRDPSPVLLLTAASRLLPTDFTAIHLNMVK